MRRDTNFITRTDAEKLRSIMTYDERECAKYLVNAMSRRKSLFFYIQSSEIQENIVDIYCIFYIFTSENIKSYIFTPQECTYKFSGLPLTFPLTYCSALQNFKRL